jgi:hypothetical protein
LKKTSVPNSPRSATVASGRSSQRFLVLCPFQVDTGLGEDPPDQTGAVISTVVRSSLPPEEAQPIYNRPIDV